MGFPQDYGNPHFCIQEMKHRSQKQQRFLQGTTIQWEHKLPDVPCAVQAFYHEAPWGP